MDIFEDKEVLASTLYDAIREETQRIVTSGIAKPDEVLGYVNPYIEDAISKSEDDKATDDLILTLSRLHLKLMGVKLPGDMPQTPLPKVESKEEHCQCQTKEATEEEEVKNVAVKVAIGRLEENLSNVIYALGKAGHHTHAFAIERKLNELKRLAVDGELMVTAGFKAEIELIQDFKDKLPGIGITRELRKETANFGDPLVAAHELRKKWEMELK